MYTLYEKAKAYLTLFLDTVSIHGFNHLVAKRRYNLETIFWLILIKLSIIGSIYLSSLTWIRYQSSPTVISMDRDMFAWNTTLPSVTLCPDTYDKIDRKKLKVYTSNFTDENKVKFEKFIRSLANATYKSFEYVQEYPDIPPNKYMETLLNLSFHFEPLLTFEQRSETTTTVVPTITEMGLCYAVNSRVAVYNSPEYRSKNRWDYIDTDKYTWYSHPLDGEVFAKLEMHVNITFDIYLHGPQDIPDITTKFQRLIKGCLMKIYVTAVSVYTSAEAATLKVNQRRCRFPRENNLKHNSVYSYTMCRMECRIRLCLKYCKCIPYFYRRIGDEQICDVQGLHCLSKYKDELYKPQDKNGKRIDCGCLSVCDEVNYIVPPLRGNKWILGTTLQWGMATYPRVRYRRDIIFGFTNLLVAVGSMAGLFLGCCVLSFLEIVYFLTLRLFWYSYGYR